MQIDWASVGVPGAQSRKNAAIAPKWFNSLDTNFTVASKQTGDFFQIFVVFFEKLDFNNGYLCSKTGLMQ